MPGSGEISPLITAVNILGRNDKVSTMGYIQNLKEYAAYEVK
jgi:hypothetical protein